MNYSTVLVVGAHPDDEILLAGTIAKLSRGGTRVVVVTFTDGSEGYARIEHKDKIVEMRKREAVACDEVLGIAERIMLGRPDMQLENNKENFKELIRIIRRVRPEAIFTFGPNEIHRDHKAAHELTMEARWQAGEPVTRDLGESWHTPHLYYFGRRLTRGPFVEIDITDVYDKKLEAWCTQVSQHTLFGKTKENYQREIEEIRATRPHQTERFTLSDHVILHELLPQRL